MNQEAASALYGNLRKRIPNFTMDEGDFYAALEDETKRKALHKNMQERIGGFTMDYPTFTQKLGLNEQQATTIGDDSRSAAFGGMADPIYSGMYNYHQAVKDKEDALQGEEQAQLPITDHDRQLQEQIRQMEIEGKWGKPNGTTFGVDKQTGMPTITKTEGDGTHLYTGEQLANQDEIDALKSQLPSYLTREVKTPQDLLVNTAEAWSSNTEMGRDFKDMLDAGTITPEEYKQAMIDANEDYINQQTRILGQKATNATIADISRTINPIIEQLQAERREAMQRAAGQGQMRGGAYGAIGAQMSANTAYDSKKDAVLSEYLQAQQYLVDAIKISEAAQKGEGFWKGLGKSVGDADTWDMGISQLVRSANLKKIVEKYEKQPDSLTDSEKALMDAAVAYMSACAYNSDKLSRMYKAGQTTGESLPFMLQFAIMPIGAIKDKVAKGILGYGIEQFGGKALQTAGKYTFGRAAAETGTALLGNMAAAGVQTATFGVPKIAEGTISRMTGDIKPEFDENGRIVYGGRENQQGVGEALWNAGVDTYVENLSEMILTSGDPIKAFVRGTNLFKNLTKNEAIQVLTKMSEKWGESTMGKMAGRMQFRNYPEEVAEEYVGNLLRWGASTDVNSAAEAGLDADSQIDLWMGLAPTSIAFAGLGLGEYSVRGGIDRFQSSQAARKLRKIMLEGEERKYLENLLKSRDSDEFKFAAHDVVKSILRNDKLSAREKRAYLDNLYVTYQSQLALEAEDAKIADEVKTEVQGITNKYNGYVYPVSLVGDPNTQGHIVAGYVEVDESDPSKPRIGNDEIVTVKLNDGRVVQLSTKELDLTGTPQMAQEVFNTRAEERINAQRLIDKSKSAFHEGEEGTIQVPNPQTGELDELPSKILSVTDEGVQVEITDFAGQSTTALISHDEALRSLRVVKPQEVQQEQPQAQETPAEQPIVQQPEAAVEPTADNIVIFSNGTEEKQAIDNGDGTYTIMEKGENNEDIPFKQTEEWLNNRGYARVEAEQPESQTINQGASQTEGFGQGQNEGLSQTVIEQPAAPNIETMSTDEFVRATVEDRYKGNRAKAQANIAAKLNGAKTELQTVQKEFDKFQKKGITSSMNEDQWDAQYDQYEQKIKGLTALVSKLEAANIAAAHYKTQAELQEEAERKAREAAMREQRRQLAEAEAAGDIEAKWQNTKKTVGFAATKTLPNGQKVNGHYILTEAGDVIPSHDPRQNYADSDGYVMENGQNVNDNNYKDPEVQKIANDIAQNYGGQAVEQMPFLENKAGRVLSGNNRTISGIIAAENNTDQAYLAALAENAQQYGFTPEQLAEYQHPRLQFVVEDELPFTTGTFAMFNQQEKKTKSSVNRAVANSKMVTEAVRDRLLEIMDQYDSLDSFFGSSNAASAITQTLINEGLMTKQEVAEKMDDSGIFNQTGKEYVTDMLLGTLFDEQTIRMLAGEKTLKQAILRALPSIVENRRLKGYELTENINKAISLLYEARKANKGKSTAEAFQLYLRQVDAFKGKVKDNFSEFEIILAGEMANGVERTRDLLNMYNNSAENEANGQDSLLDKRTPEDIKQQVYEHYAKQQPELTAAINGAAVEGAESQSSVPSSTEELGEVRQVISPEQLAALRQQAQEFSDKLGVPIVVFDSIDEVPDSEKAAKELYEKEGNKVDAWMSADGKTIYVNANSPEIQKEGGLQRKVFHEVVAHKGLRQLLGNQTFGQLCAYVWEAMPVDQRVKYYDYAQQNYPGRSEDEWRLIAADEFMAFNAEKFTSLDANDQSEAANEVRTIWQKIADKLRELLDKILGDSYISDDALAELYRMSYNNLRQQAQETKIVPERPNSKQLQGMSYNVAEAEDYIGRVVRNILDENGYNDVEIVGTKVIGSRVNGNAREDSDLDAIVEFKGDAREDSLFNLFAGENIELDGVKVDVNPITEGKSGTIEQFMRRSDEYLAEKNAESVLPKTPDDLRLSVSGTQTIPVGKNTLVGLHNISAEKLRKALKMGGLANPSTAVIDIARQNHEQYGDISLIMPSSLVDSKTGRNAGTFTGDIWSPTYPSVERIMSDKGDENYYQTITKLFANNEARQPILSRIKLDFNDYLDSGNVRAGLAYWYLLEKGIEPGDVYFNSGISDDIKERFRPLYDKGILDLTKEDYRTLLSLIAEQQGKTAEDMLQDAQESKARYQQTIDDPEAKQFYKKIAQQAIDEIDLYGVRYNVLSNGYHAMERAIREDGKIDLTSTLIAAQDIVQTQYQSDFDKWLSDMDKRFDIKEVLFEDYDRDGNRIYKPHTLANASRMMNKEDLQNAGDHAGLGATRGQLVERMETLADIRAEKSRLRPGAEEDFETEEWNKMQDEWFNKVLNPLAEMQKISDNPFSQVGYAETRLQEALRTKDPIATLNKEYGYKIDPNGEWAKNLKDLVQRIKSLPTKYFETKFRRPVYLDEFRNAVVPNDLPTELREGLEKAGLTLFEYDPKEEGARRAATLQATEDEGIRFSVSGGLDTDRTLTKAAREEMQQIKDAALADGTFMKAPNGKRSNLNERQWLQVRTRAFQRMFGDWQNDPENATKVLDENGEPMVMYHGTWNDFTTFDKKKIYSTNFGKGFYFISDMQKALSYGHYLMPVFLNVRKPLDLTTGDNDAEYNKWYGKKKNPYDGYTFIPTVRGANYTMVVVPNPNQIKSAIDNDGSFSEENDDIRFSVSNASEEIFFSNAERAVESIKQEKATPAQWLAMIEKARGLKAGEDKWIGLSDWLKAQHATVEMQPGETRSQYIVRLGEASKKFTISKQDILDYIRENKIQIEEVPYAEGLSTDAEQKLEEFNAEFEELIFEGDEETGSIYTSDWVDYAWRAMVDRYGDDFESAFEIEGEGTGSRLTPTMDYYGNYSDVALYFLGEGESRPINGTRLQYTTEGLQNKREIALVVPTIESWNQGDEIHFGDAGEGRAIAWIRFGDTEHTSSPDGIQQPEDVLVIDEIQSNRHQQGREKGYKASPTDEERKEIIRREKVAQSLRSDQYDYEREMKMKYGTTDFPDTYSELMTEEEKATWRQLNKDVDEAEQELNELKSKFPYNPSVPPVAPFEKNWHELAMKRILRFAAENGYDKVAWTTGEQQAKRYDIGKEIDHIVKTDDYSYEVYPTSGLMMNLDFDEDGIYRDDSDREYNGKSMSDIFGKELAKRLQEMPVDETLQGDGLRVGYDGMKGFYDEMLPRFMQKYGKKWGVQVGEVTMPDLEQGYQTMHSVDITPEMRESVLQGQPMFSVTGSRGAANIDKMEGVTTRMDNLAAARQMEEDGKDAKTIRMATGWERGADGKWRYEIADVQLNTDNVKANFRKLDRRGVTAPMVWYHNKFTDIIADSPERKQLLAAYPQLADLDIEFYDYPNKERGAYSSEKKKISVNRANVRSVDECRSVLLHEIQHAIQEAELFAKGTSKEQIQLTWKLNNEVHNKVDEYFDKMGFKEWLTSHNGDKAFVDRLMQVIHMFPNRDFNIHYLFVETLPRDKQIDAIDVLGDANDVIQSNRDAIYGADRKGMTMKPDELYHNAAGEVESRNVQNRMNLTPDERRERLLAETEDVAREDQIVIMNAFDMANDDATPRGTMDAQPGESKVQYAARIAEEIKRQNPKDTSLDEAIRFSITVNHNSPYLLKRADGAFVDPETGERLGFDLRFIGKGEGGQAHGYGSYFSKNDIREYAEAKYFNRTKLNTYKGMLYDEVPKTLENFVPRMILNELGGTEIALAMQYATPESKFAEAVKYVRNAINYRADNMHDLLDDYYRAELADEPIDNVYSKVIRRDPKELAEEQLKQLDAISIEDFELARRHHYTVEIPDNDGTNYFDEDKPLTQEQIDRLRKAAKETGIPKFLETISGFLRFAETNPEEYPFRKFYSDITDFQYGYPRETISNFFKDAGFVGIHYDGRRDGECYVIFNPDDAVITDHIRFSVTGGINDHKTPVFDTQNTPYLDTQTPGVYTQEPPVDDSDDQIRFSVVTSRKKIAELEAGEKIKVYRAAQVIDGKLYPPMAAKQQGQLVKPIELGRWEQAEEHPELAKDGKFKLDKANGSSAVPAAYNPYFHTSRSPLNDQFSSAYDRPNLVTLEVEVPASELTSGYKAEGAKDAVGETSWHSGAVSGKLAKAGEPRKVILSRWDKPLRIVPDAEVAEKIAGMLAGKDIAIPYNVVTPSLRAELEKQGVTISDQPSGTVKKPKDDIRFSVNNPSTLSRSETVTKALVQQANNNYNIMQSALKKVTADLKGIRAAMRMQSDYDRKVVDALLNLYNTLLQENGVWAQYMPDTTRRIATQIVHAIGKKNITKEVNTIMDHMVHAQAKAAQRQWDKLRQTPIDKINISGVVMQGKVALEGQHALKAMNDALQANMTIEQIEEQINQLMDMEDNATDESLKTQYKGQWIGLTIAAQHLERLQHLQEERQQLDLELQSARSNKALKPAARQQLVDNIKQAMRDNYIEQAEAYTRSMQDLSEYVNTQEGRAKDFIRRQDANRDKIRSYAQRDLRGISTDNNRDESKVNIVRSIWDAVASPIRDLQSLLRLCGRHAPDGEGYLYNHFMRNWMDAADTERLGIVAASKTLDAKIAELTHGKYKTWEEAARKINDASHNMFTVTTLNGIDGEDMPYSKEMKLSAGNALYIYAVNKMNDGRMKLNGMNITEEDVKALVDAVREKFGQEILDVVDWIQSEFFSQLRDRYNPTHIDLFGAPMDAIENYFPLRLSAAARKKNVDLGDPDTDVSMLLSGSTTGAIKRRTKNSIPIDLHADFFKEVIRHVAQMERWNAFAQWTRDANILFSDTNFRERVKNMDSSIYGKGDALYNYMRDAFKVANGTYRQTGGNLQKGISDVTLNIAKGVTSAKINFRVWTAMKQIASFPAFFTYMQDGTFVKSYMHNWGHWSETMEWAKENLPNFEKRVSKRDLGDFALMRRSTDWKITQRIMDMSTKYGMAANVFFDTLTCATGARAVYESHLAEYMKKGYSEEDARNRARQDAEQAFNTSQQSSEGAFMAPVQADRNIITSALTVFRTSPIQYTRNFFYHTRGIARKLQPGAKEKMIAFRMDQYKNDGLNDEQARKAAEMDFDKSMRQDIVGFVVYGAVLNILWRLAGNFLYYLFGDDDDKKKELLLDAVTGGAFVSPITGLLGGGNIESYLDDHGSISSILAPELPLTQDVKKAEQYLNNNKYAEFASQALSIIIQSSTGFDPQTAADAITRVVVALDSEQELDAAQKSMFVLNAMLSIPQSQYEQMLIDKVVSGETDEDAALEDYIRYYKVHTAPLTFLLRGEESDEKAEENAEKRFNRLLNERDELHNPEEE